jgi:tRNA 2-selenouridine synthase SelU
MLMKRYGGRGGKACTRGRLRSEQVPQWLRRRNGEDGLTATGSAFSTAKVCMTPKNLIGHIIAWHCWH